MDGLERLAVRVSKDRAEEVRRMLVRENLFDGSRGIVREGETVLIPVRASPGQGLEVVEAELPVSRRLKTPFLRAAFDVVGWVAVVNDMDMSYDAAVELARDIVRRHPRVRTVLQKTGEVAGEERVASYRVLLGDPCTETTHRESGCLFRLDVAKTFFSPRLSGERIRVASQVGEHEKVLDMFAGVGPFSIIIARRKPSATVFAVEKNPDAFKYLCINVELNKAVGRVKPLHGDSAEVVPRLDTEFNRIIMNLPHSSVKYLPTAVQKAAPQAVVHLYVVEERASPGSVLDCVLKSFSQLRPLDGRVVKEVSPKYVMKVYDLRVVSTGFN
ncbi:MAG: class I SAM-dependent methyltransferase family protein [Candidatus Caldarchaeum sp.]